jgi:hypothetical protein
MLTQEQKRAKKAKMLPGAKVRLTGAFLRSTGQIAGGEGHMSWLVQECNCPMCQGEYVATNEPHYCQENPEGFEDIAPEERPKWRHFHITNVEATK